MDERLVQIKDKRVLLHGSGQIRTCGKLKKLPLEDLVDGVNVL